MVAAGVRALVVCRLLAAIAPAIVSAPVLAKGGVLIWPVNPVLKAETRSAPLWLENPGTAPVTLQVRIFAWHQADGQNRYDAQDAMLGSPPVFTVAPGRKQLVRLTRLTEASPPGETAYRIIIDEIPTRTDRAAGSGVTFRMRYSLPFFTYGKADARARPAPELSWRIIDGDKGPEVEIRNDGALHARMVDVGFITASGQRVALASGLLGYVLAGGMARWTLPDGVTPNSRLDVRINGDDSQRTIPPAF